MAYTTKAKGTIVRRLGINIFANPKYDALLKKKPQGPGKPRGDRRRRKESEFSLQLKEKQKLRYAYGMNERQFANTFLKAKKAAGQTGTNLLVLLEQRLDNVVFRLGFAATRAQARQMVSHGHILVEGKRVTIPSFSVSPSDVIRVRMQGALEKQVRERLTKVQAPTPVWLNLKEDDLSGTIVRLPLRDDIPSLASDQMVVEYYSR